MSQFIKLTSRILNKNLISSVYIKPNLFHIYTMETVVHGAFIFGGGIVDSKHEKIEICEKENPLDYKIVKGWIDTL